MQLNGLAKSWQRKKEPAGSGGQAQRAANYRGMTGAMPEMNPEEPCRVMFHEITKNAVNEGLKRP